MAELPPMTRRRFEVERKIHSALEQERAKHADSAFYVRLSAIGKCQRELWAIRTGIPDERPPGGQALMTFDVGHHVEGAVIEWLRKAGYEVQCERAGGKQLRVWMRGETGVGHIDGLIRWESRSGSAWRLLEIKTAKAKKFEELLECRSYRAWNEGYYDQVQGYMGASASTADVPTLTDCLVVVVCKDDSRLWCEMIAFDPERYAELEAKARLVVKSDEIVPRPKSATSQYCKFCKWCSRNAWCWSPLAGVEFDA